MQDKPLILLAEQNPDDLRILQAALEQAGVSHPIHVVADCEEVIRYLKGEGPYADRSAHRLPAVILLGARLPLLNGFHALRWIREHAEYDHIKVGILAGSEFPNEHYMAYKLGADSYQVKPISFNRLVDIFVHLRADWLDSDEPHQAAA